MMSEHPPESHSEFVSVGPEEHREGGHRPPSFTRRDLVWLLLLLLVAFGTRAYRIDFPSREYFDEIYYVDAAKKIYAGQEDPNSVHPLLGKLQLGLGIELVDFLRFRGVPLNETVGWRLGSLVLGVAIIPLTFYLGWIMPGGGRFVAFTAAGLVSFDFMHLVQSRIAMLDMYQAFWIMLGLVAAWKYLEAGKRSSLWALAAAVMFGLATACKWSGLFAAVGAFAAMVWLWPAGFNWKRLVALSLLFSLVIPAIYLLSYTPLFLREGAIGPKQLKTIQGYHERMVRFRYNQKEFDHRYLSPFYSWPVDYKPVWYVYEEEPKDEPMAENKKVRGVVTIGNPLFWLPFLMFLLEATILAWTRRDRARAFLVLTYFPQVLLWASATTGGFIYYMLPCIPIMALISGMALLEWTDTPFWRRALIGYFVCILISFAVFFPLLTGLSIPEGYFRRLFFIRSWI